MRRGVSTVQRWEKFEALPVHRHLHGKQGSIYAYKSEVDAWWKDRQPSLSVRKTLPRSTRYGRIRATPKASRTMLAILPFENLSGNPTEEYFSDGMTEELITELGSSSPEDLGIIARTSIMGYRQTRKPVREIGRELGVDYILEGSVRRAGENVRITAQLIQVSDQTHLWAESYDRHFTDILTLQRDVAQAVARRIGLKLTPPGQTDRAGRHPTNPQAYDAYLQGRFHWHKLSRHHFDTALEYFELALRRDPSYALAHEGIASVWSIRGDNGVVAPAEARPRVQEALAKAMRLDGTLADVRKTLANFRFMYEWDWASAEAEFQRAIDLNPNDPDVRLFYADLLISMGRKDEWQKQIQRALELDPLNFFLHCFLGWHLVYLHRYEEAIVQLRKTLKSEPNFASAHLGLWGAFYKKHNYEAALREATTFFASIGDSEVAELLGDGRSKIHYAKAMHRAADVLEARAQKTYVPFVRIARLHAHAGDEIRALASLEKACEQREPPLVHVNVGWDWDVLRAFARFQALRRRMGFPE